MTPATILHEAEVELWEAVEYYESRSRLPAHNWIMALPTASGGHNTGPIGSGSQNHGANRTVDPRRVNVRSLPR